MRFGWIWSPFFLWKLCRVFCNHTKKYTHIETPLSTASISINPYWPLYMESHLHPNNIMPFSVGVVPGRELSGTSRDALQGRTRGCPAGVTHISSRVAAIQQPRQPRLENGVKPSLWPAATPWSQASGHQPVRPSPKGHRQEIHPRPIKDNTYSKSSIR